MVIRIVSIASNNKSHSGNNSNSLTHDFITLDDSGKLYFMALGNHTSLAVKSALTKPCSSSSLKNLSKLL
jgi:hypothetical protein